MAQIIITGASGFIGLPTVKTLLNAGHKVSALSRKQPDITHDNFAWRETDLMDNQAVISSMQQDKADVLMHLAWQGIPDFSLDQCQHNLLMSQNVIEHAVETARVKRVIVTGSCFEYNRQQGVCDEDQITEPRDHFTWSKLALLEWVKMFAQKNDVELGWMRVFYAYGLGQREQSLIPSLIASIKAGQTPDIRTPTARNDFVHVNDVATALNAAVTADAIDGIYNIGTGQSVSIYDICCVVDHAITGTTETAEAVLNNATGSSDVDFWANASTIKTALNWTTTTSLNDGIGEMCSS